MSSLELSAGALQLSLIDAYIIDLQDTFTQVLGPGTTFIGPPRCCALLGGEIVIQIDQLPAGVAFSDAADKFDQIAQCSKLIISSWVQDDSLHAKVSPNPWKSTRVDRYSGSRVHDMGDTQAISSIDRPQKIKVVHCDRSESLLLESPETANPGSSNTIQTSTGRSSTRASSGISSDATGALPSLSFNGNHTAMNHDCSSMFSVEARFEEYQTMSLHLMASLRLSPTDVSTVLHLLADQGLSWEQIGELRDLSSVIPPGDVMIRHAIDALIRPVTSGAYKQLVPAHILPQVLKGLQIMDGMSAVRESMANKYVVIFHVHRRSFHESSRALGQSYFVQFEKHAEHCESHVHILETQLAGLENCHVLTFTQMPTKTIADTAIAEIKQLFGVPDARITRTTPVMLSKPLFRADGMTDRPVLDHFAGQMKTALQKNRGSKTDINLEICTNSPVPRDPNTYVVFTRQSAEESGALSNTSVPRQATSIFTSPESPLRGLQAHDNIVVMVEVCSSHKHPLRDRTIFERLPVGENLVFLTANVDRLTRRADEVDEILSKGRWISSGLHEARTTWFDVAENIDKVKAHLTLGEHVSRVLNASVLIGFRSIESISIGVLLLYNPSNHPLSEHRREDDDARDWCDTDSHHRDVQTLESMPSNETNKSLIRQQQFLEMMIPQDLRHRVEILRANQISASSSDFCSLLADRLSTIAEPTLVLSTSTDRVSRRAEDLSVLNQLSHDGSHVFTALIWDSQTPIAAVDPLKGQERSMGQSLKLPKLIPIVWSPCKPDMLSHVKRHLDNAQDWAKAVSHTSFQGEAQEVPVQLATTNGRLLDRNHLTQWYEFLNQEVPVPVTVIRNACEKGVVCSCHGCAEDCTCSCAGCERERACPCALTLVCTCPAICDCRCEFCHRFGTQLKGNKAKIPDNYTNLERKCITAGCENKAPSNTQMGLFCKECYAKSRSAERVCWTIGCTNPAPFKGPTGKACVECAKTNPDPSWDDSSSKRNADCAES
ncbi:hypothetical protein D6D19_10562 [Aureobasidium pullulans]|uniref:Uncharacterized protein n=1 Tax=Aureobasidium pullulans TaxID=5580 RepID=A0A4S8YSQ7_AURPU|nr:hypothetical protein D6D19_10562 [Aureobasidium pullulans]